MDVTIKVIICEDHELFRKGVKHSLSHKKDICFVGEADNGLNLVRLLNHVTPDVILLDINMPVMDGKAALLEIRKNYPDIKVIMLTMHDEESTILDMMKNGANAFLTKECGEEKIYDAIVSCYKTGKYIDEITSSAMLKLVQGKIKDTEYKPRKIIIPQDKTDVNKIKKININYQRVVELALITAASGAILILAIYFFMSLNKNLQVLKNFTIP